MAGPGAGNGTGYQGVSNINPELVQLLYLSFPRQGGLMSAIIVRSGRHLHCRCDFKLVLPRRL